MSTSAFGVEHPLSKGMLNQNTAMWSAARKAAKVKAKGGQAEALTVKFKPIVPKKATGPGSARARMSGSAWESQTAARRR